MKNFQISLSNFRFNRFFLFIGLLFWVDTAFSQSSDSLKYFPCDSGDTWFYWGEDGYSTIKIDSVVSQPLGKKVYGNFGAYVIDTTTCVLYSENHVSDDSVSLFGLYRFDAQVGDYWVEDTISYRYIGVGLALDNPVEVFGVPTRKKSFVFFHFYSDTSLPPHDPTQWFPYITRSFAYGFGMIEEGIEGGGGRILIGAILHGDSMGIISDVKEERKTIPDRFSLFQNYPNPFNPTTAISYQLSAVSDVALKIYDVLGKEVRTLVNQGQTAGQHVVQWDGTDQHGWHVASGVYYYRLTTPNGSITKKAVLVK